MLLVISSPGGHYVLGSELEIITLWPHATFVVCFLLCLFINHTVLFYARSQQLHQGSSCDDDTKFICWRKKNVSQGTEKGCPKSGRRCGCPKFCRPPAAGISQLPSLRWIRLPGQLRDDHSRRIHRAVPWHEAWHLHHGGRSSRQYDLWPGWHWVGLVCRVFCTQIG